MVKTVEDYMERYHMIKEGDVVVAGVSGGADSVCLFWILKEYCKKRNVGLVVVHINHGIRQDAVKDAEFVEKMCRESNVEIRIFDLDIPAYAKELGIGTEEAGRRARYEAFEEVHTGIMERLQLLITVMIWQKPPCFICCVDLELPVCPGFYR